MTTITDRYNAIVEENPTFSKAKIGALLTLEDYTAKQIAEVIPKRTRGTTFRSDYYDLLVEGSVTEQEAKDFLEDNGTENDKRHAGHYLAIRELAERIREA